MQYQFSPLPHLPHPPPIPCTVPASYPASYPLATAPVPDKKVVFRIVIVNAAAFVQHKDWLVTVWKVLSEVAPYVWDYLMPAPTNNYKGANMLNSSITQRLPFSHESAYRGQRRFKFSTSHHFYTPHSGRNYMPTAVLNFPKAERHIVGGWASEGSERYTRVAKHRIAVMQRAVAGALQKTEEPDPLAESDAVDALDDFLRLRVQDQERTRTKKLLCSRTHAGGPRGLPTAKSRRLCGSRA